MYLTKKLYLALFATILAAAMPTYADAVVQGSVYTNLTGPLTNVYNSPLVIGPPTSQTVSWSYTCSTCSGYGLSASGAARVTNGILGATSTVSVTGTTPSNYSAESDSYTQFTDQLTITGGTGSGVLQLQFAADGSVTKTGTGINSSFAYLALFQTSGVYSGINGGPVTSGDIQYFNSGSTVTFEVPFTYGTQFSMEPVMRTAADFYEPYDGDTTPFTTTVDFYSTATLTSALVFNGTPDALGSQVSDADISSTTGFDYGPNGLTAIPEPGTLMLVSLALGALLFINWWSRRTA